jgi:VWFA-related protein
MRRHTVAVLAVVGLVGVSARAQQTSQPQQPPLHFEARADLVLVDANVVDDSGNPIQGLTAADFEVSVDGKPRPLASVQFVKQDAPPESEPRPPAPAHYSTNEGASAGRDIIIVVDENSLPPMGGRAVLASVEKFLANISPADRVAFVRMPDFVGSVDLTTDRAKVREALKKVMGRTLRGALTRLSVGEAAAHERGNDMAWQNAVARHCAGESGPAYEACAADLQSEAQSLWQEVTHRARQTVDGLRGLLQTMRQIPGPKTLMLISQGFSAEDTRADVQTLARLAAEARVSIYVLQIDMSSFDIAESQPSMTRMEDDRVMAEGLDTLSGAARGARFRVVGTGERIFERVARELSGYYLLGFEPTAEDKDGKPHRIRVEVKRRDVTVRARAQFTINPAGANASSLPAPAGEAADPRAVQLIELLRAPGINPGLPLRLAAYTAPGSTSDKVKVIIGADIGAPTKEAAEMQVGFVLVDSSGKVAGNQLAAVKLQPSRGDEAAPLQYVGNAEVPAGDYTLRFAAIDADGREGSVHHAVRGTLPNEGGVRVSDLILTEPVRGGAVRPVVHLRLEAPALQAVMELGATEPKRLNDTRVTFEVADSADGEAIVSARGRLGNESGGRRQVSAVVDVGVLPPGMYVGRAVVTVTGEDPITITRPFEVATRARVATTARDGERSATPAVARGRMRPPIPPFRKEDVLAPDVVAPFVDHVIENYSPSPAARAALEDIKAGNLETATKGEREVTEVGMSFAQGLSLLARGRTKEADTFFRAALRGASDFIGAAFYLGATLAASGKDRDAVGAWQTALISDVGAAGVYPVLIDGLLRIGDAEQALEFLEEAEPTFTDRLQYTRRLAQAYALAGRYADASPLADEYLAAHPNDTDMLFLALHLLYERHAIGETLDDAARARFEDYARRYEAAKAPQVLVVRGWKKALGSR